MISAVFLISFFAFAIGMYLWIPLWYLIPIWIVIGYPIGILVMLLFVYINFIWMSKTKPTNKLKNYMAHSITFLINHFIFRVRVNVEGRENIPKNDRLLTTYANHKSLLDPFPIMEVLKRPTTFTPKSEVMSYPLIGKYLKYLGSFVIDRSSDRNTAKGLVNAIRNAKDGMNYVIFPEGGIRTRENEQMVEMRPGAYKLAMKAKTDLLVISMKNMTQIHKRFPWRSTKIYMKIHPVIPFEDIENLSTADIAKMVYDLVNSDFK
ncbi:MAG: lysophospholipid acyltransferase family protein [Acholeplasmataceae bacterium]